MLDEPVDRIVGVGTFVCILWTLHRLVPTNIFKRSLAHVSSAHILINENEFLFLKEFGGTYGGAKHIRAVRTDGIWRPIHHDGIRFPVRENVLRNIDRSE